MYIFKISEDIKSMSLGLPGRVAVINEANKMSISTAITNEGELTWADLPGLPDHVSPVEIEIAEDNTLIASGSDKNLYIWSGPMPPGSYYSTAGWEKLDLGGHTLDPETIACAGVGAIYFANSEGKLQRFYGAGFIKEVNSGIQDIARLTVAADGTMLLTEGLSGDGSKIFEYFNGEGPATIIRGGAIPFEIAAGSASKQWLTFESSTGGPNVKPELGYIQANFIVSGMGLYNVKEPTDITKPFQVEEYTGSIVSLSANSFGQVAFIGESPDDYTTLYISISGQGHAPILPATREAGGLTESLY